MGSDDWDDNDMRYALFASLLAFPALPACASQTADRAVTAQQVQCSVVGVENAGAAEDDICAMFREAIFEARRTDVDRIVITAASSTAAQAEAFAKDGTPIGDLGFDIMDTRLHPAAWQEFAHTFAQHLVGQG